MTQDQFPTEKCTFTLAFDCKTIPIVVFFVQLQTFPFELRRYVPVFTDNYRFPYNTKSLGSKDFSDPLESIARRRGTNYIK